MTRAAKTLRPLLTDPIRIGGGATFARGDRNRMRTSCPVRSTDGDGPLAG